ncbi:MULTISPECIES: IclR family transcriptional regulator [unclassified Sedimentibacter]|uniref:IclR family transcriptional regulator n=1 Tax=unclassified Sedimentibacter TaxID=2649220 RepID=UPI0027E20360|nr:IclR family transcriptional regulator [Sedimentibacter sp. MB35-C1]WMJ78337.1 IclR family transcriptional regulator [Sedimentibacter sp. MB35-C1]
MNILGKVLSVDKALLIIRLLAEKGREMKLTEISDELDINKSTLHGLISTLKYHGFVDQDGKTQKYRLGLYLIQLGDIASKSLNIIQITTPIIENVCNKLQETVHIGSLDNSEVVYVNKKESKQSMRIYTNIGARNPAYCTGLGKAMLAYLDDDTINKIIPEKLEKLTPNTITDKQELIKVLKTVKENGYAFDNEEIAIGLTCLAAPIFDYTGKAIYGISVSGPTVRMDEDKIQESIKIIKEAAEEISLKIGYID